MINEEQFSWFTVIPIFDKIDEKCFVILYWTGLI